MIISIDEARKIMGEANKNYTDAQLKEIIKKIERLGGEYDPTSAFSIDHQLFICESLAQKSSSSYLKEENNNNANESVSVNGNVNDTYKRQVNFELTQSKHRVLTKLKECNYKTPTFEIADLLQELFVGCNTKSTHPRYLAENWNPREINRTLDEMTKIHGSSWSTLNNPAAYFTYLIKFRKHKKKHRK